MILLLSNDDGIGAPGLQVLEASLSDVAECHVVAPSEERSACGHSLTLRQSLRPFRHGERRHSVSGSPADAVYVGIHHLLPERPAMVVSGINDGANLAFDTYYSGTVAAAREAVMAGIPAFAVSLCTDRSLAVSTRKHFESAGVLARELALSLLDHPLPEGHFWNLNVPDRPLAEIRGLRAVGLGRRFWEPRVEERRDPAGKPYLWLGGKHLGFAALPDSDGPTVLDGWATLTPLRLDTTARDLLGDPSVERLDRFLEGARCSAPSASPSPRKENPWKT
jgi:5'-nucleotidase